MTNKSTDLISLPDYPTLQQLARSLWQAGSVRGAAVLVGAGVSKNAKRSGNDTLEPPLWWELLEQLKKRLYPENPERAPSDALRVAEEYRTFFGQAGLDDFIRVNFPDRSWLPGPLHRELLALPWTDVLTTNWDTLLERTAEELTEPSYTVVKTDSDLTYARSPRIVKLHGTLGNKDPLIFAEEDYRTYPIKYAAFVNFARQIFIENELVLIGFSGDDPNFLQWAGWVRDHLGGNARRIYLAGNLGLRPATRKYLEAQNISPIDLAPLVSHLPRSEQHSEALYAFLEGMRNGKPPSKSEWKKTPYDKYPINKIDHKEYRNLITDDAKSATLLEETIPLLTANRKAYPGWYLCPVKHRFGRSPGTEERILLRETSLNLLSHDAKSELIFELVWHHVTHIEPIDGNLQLAAEKLIGDDKDGRDQQTRTALLSAILYRARWSNEAAAFEQYSLQAEAENNVSEDFSNYSIYQRCLRARDHFDFELLADKLSQITSEDPVWRLRRAALHCEIGEYARATKLIKDALAELERRFRSDRDSIWIKSCLAWASYIHNASQELATRSEELKQWNFHNLDINPKSEIEYFDNRVSYLAEKKRGDEAEIRPSFEVGVYREGRKKGVPGSDAIGLLYEFEFVLDHLGLPTRINHVNICADTALAVLELAASPSFVWYASLLRVLHSHYDRAFERHFSRLAVAQIPDDQVRLLISATSKAIEFWNRRLIASTSSDLAEDKRRCVDYLRLQIMALSRLTVRMTIEEAKITWISARYLSTKEELHHPWIVEAINELLKFSLQALPSSERTSAIFEVIDYPLSSERSVDAQFAPELIGEIWSLTPVRDPDDTRWKHRISQLLALAEVGKSDRKEAISRLAYLHKRKALTEAEKELFAKVLWAGVADNSEDYPSATDLLTTAFADLPAPNGIDVSLRIQKWISAQRINVAMTVPQNLDSQDMMRRQQLIMSIARASDFGVIINSETAERMFEEIVHWRPLAIDRRDSFGAPHQDNFNKKIVDLAGLALSRSIIPSLPHQALDHRRLSLILEFSKINEAWTSAEALPYFAVTSEQGDRIAVAIRTGLASARSQRAGNAAVALGRWLDLEKENRTVELPRGLIEYILINIESGKEAGLHALIDVASKMLDSGKFDEPDIDRVILALGGIRQIYNYSDVLPETSRAVIVSLVRASCVKLSKKILDIRSDNEILQAWLEEGKIDPLPEVRFSLSQDMQ